MLIVPGGEYRWINVKGEGLPAAAWLNGLGCIGCILRYRLPAAHAWPAPRNDLLAAIEYLQSDASKKWHIDVERLGVLGFSAGASSWA